MSSTALSYITGRIGKIARCSDLATLDAFVSSEQFVALFARVPPGQRPSALMAYGSARAKCLKRVPVAAPGTAKADWKKPGEIERFKRAWEQHGGNRYLVAREMGITEGAAKIAHLRFIVKGATATYTSPKNASRKPQDGRFGSRLPMAPRSSEATVRASLAAA